MSINLFPNENEKAITKWKYNKKYDVLPRLKKEHEKIINDMSKKYGKLTDDDEIELLFWLWAVNNGKEKLE